MDVMRRGEARQDSVHSTRFLDKVIVNDEIQDKKTAIKIQSFIELKNTKFSLN